MATVCELWPAGLQGRTGCSFWGLPASSACPPTAFLCNLAAGISLAAPMQQFVSSLHCLMPDLPVSHVYPAAFTVWLQMLGHHNKDTAVGWQLLPSLLVPQQGSQNAHHDLQVSMWAMPMYSILPAVTEWVVEQGWTRSYTRIEENGTPKYLALFAAYMCCVEYFVYWSHRSLHDIRLGYRCV